MFFLFVNFWVCEAYYCINLVTVNKVQSIFLCRFEYQIWESQKYYLYYKFELVIYLVRVWNGWILCSDLLVLTINEDFKIKVTYVKTARTNIHWIGFIAESMEVFRCYLQIKLAMDNYLHVAFSSFPLLYVTRTRTMKILCSNCLKLQTMKKTYTTNPNTVCIFKALYVYVVFSLFSLGILWLITYG